MGVVDRLCPSRSHGWHITTFTYLPGSLLHRHGHSDFHVGGCVPYVRLRAMDALPCWPRGLIPFCDRCVDGTVSVLSTETDRSWTTSDMASCTFQTHPYLSDGRESSVSFLGREQPLSFGAFTSSSVEGHI